MNRPVVLFVGGLDPSGGAGLAADIETAAALGAHAAPVASLITVQDTRRVQRSRPLAAGLVAEQAEAVLGDQAVAAVKLGALGTAAIARALARVLAGRPDLPVVTDPVLAASGGGALAGPGLVKAYAESILPLTRLATPNAAEFAALGGEAAVPALLARGLGACLVTGGDAAAPRVVHVLYAGGGRREVDAGPRLPGTFHGSGCTFAAALAVHFARGAALDAALDGAGRFVRRALENAYAPGRGQPVPGRFP